MEQAGVPDIPREILDKALELGQALATHPAVERLRQARRTVSQREAARIMLRDLRAREQALVDKQLKGETPGPQEVEELRRVAEVVGYNPYVRELWEAEAAVARLLAAVQAAVQGRLDLPRIEGVDDLEEARAEDRSRAAAPPPSRGADAPSPAAASSPGGAAPGGPGAGGGVRPVKSRLWVPGQP